MITTRSSGSLLLALLVGGTVFAAGYWMAARGRIPANRHPGDDLAWVCREFQLTDAEVERIRSLHNGYKPKCEEMAARIAAKNRELEAALVGATNVSPAVERGLAEVATLRAECQAQMLRHFQEVARTMPSAQGARYFAEMQRLTLELHAELEDAVIQSTHHEHP